jgi:hypothetical protein
VGNGNIDVGNKTPTRKPGQPIVENLAGSDGSSELRIDLQNPPKTERVRVCGAMSQQHGDSGRGNESVPQKFVQLVGCRDPKAKDPKVKAEPWARPHPAQVKR